MVSVPVSKVGIVGLFFVEPVVKVDGEYYRDVLLLQQMLPAIRHVAGDNFVFQQAVHQRIGHVAQFNCCSVKLLTISPELWLPNSPGLNSIDYKIWGVIKHTAACLWDTCQQCQWPQAATVWRVEWSAAEHCRRCRQWVEKASAGVCSHKGRTF